jgi:hypothetical protein
MKKYCPKCKETKLISEFYFNKTHDCYLSWCKSCGKRRAVESRRCLRASENLEDLLKKRLYDLLSSSKQHWKNHKKLECNLTYADLKNQYTNQCGKCFYTGTHMKIKPIGGKSRDPLNISLDRIDSDLGYIPDNIVFCCWGINALKGTDTPDVLYNSLKIFYENAKENKKI